MLAAVVADVRDGVPAGVIGARFHHAVADLVVDLAEHAAETPTVALSGGVFQNALLLRLAVAGCATRVSKSSPIAACRRTTAASRWVNCWWGTPAERETRERRAPCVWRYQEGSLSIEDRDGTLMSVVDFGGIQKDVCLQYIPTPRSANTWSCTSVSRSSGSTRSPRNATLAEFEHLGVLNEEFGDGFELAAKQAGSSTTAQRGKQPR